MNLSARALIEILERNGFSLKRTKGSHNIFYNPISNVTVAVPVHNKDLKKGTFYGIIKQAKIDKNAIG